MSYEKDKENLQKIAKYLKKAQMIHEFIDIPLKGGVKMPAIVTNYSHKGYLFDVLIMHSNGWIMVQCMLLDTVDLSEIAIPLIYEFCLTLNYDLLETTFSLHKGQIFVEADMPVSVSYEDFINVEFRSIANGIDTFMDELMIEGVEVTDTKGKIKLKFI